jgi:uncharacterized protein involved in exopolysaccharide biosynthesis
LLRRRTTALQTAVAAFAVVLIGTLLWPPTYQSTAKILVQDERAQYLVSPDLQDDAMAKQAVMARPVTQEDLNSEVELLTSRYLIKQAIQGLQPPRHYTGVGADLMGAANTVLNLPVIGYQSLHSSPALSANDRWALDLERHLHPSTIKLSNVIEVNFNSHSPAWSRDFLARIIDKYLEYHAKLSADPQAEQFFNQQAQLLKAKLEASEEQLRQFEVQNGITDLTAQKQALVTRLSDLQIQNNRIGAELAASRQQVAALTGQLQQTPERIGKEMRSVQNQALQQIKPQVMQLKAERADLLSRYQPTSQRIQEIDAKLAAAQKILDAENHLEVQEKSSDLNPIWVSLDTNLEQAKTAVSANDATQTALQSEIQKTNGDLTQITNNGVTLTRLERQVGTDKEAYLSYVRKNEEARTAQALNSSKILNVSIAEPASMPLRPIYPKVWLNLLVGLMLAAAMGVGAAYWEERQDDLIYSASAVKQASGVQTVVVFGEEA